MLTISLSIARGDFIIPPMLISTQALTNPDINKKTLSLSQALTLALEHRPEISAANFSIKEQEHKKREAWAGYLPKADLEFYSGSQWGHFPNDGPSTRLHVKQLVYNFAGPQLLAERVEKTITQQEYAKEVIKNQIRLAIEQAFITCWELQQQKKTIAKLNESSNKSFEKSTHEHNLNLLDKNNWLEKNEDRANSMLQVQAYNDDINLANKKFTYLTGQAFNLDLSPEDPARTTTELVWDGTVIGSLPSLEYCYAQGLSRRPEIKQSAKQIEFEQLSADIARRSTLPRIELDANAWHYDGGPNPITQRNFSQITGRIRWDFFDGTVSKHQTNQALARKMQATLATEQQRQSIKLEIETAYYSLSKALTALAAKNFSYAKAESTFLRKKQEYTLGLISKIEFTLAESTWLTTEFAWLSQKADVTLKKMALDYSCGYPEAPTINPSPTAGA